MDEYLTIAELSARLKIKPRTIANKMAAVPSRSGSFINRDAKNE